MFVPAQQAEFIRSFRAFAQDYVDDEIRPAARELAHTYVTTMQDVARQLLPSIGPEGHRRMVQDTAVRVAQFQEAVDNVAVEMEAQAVAYAVNGNDAAFTPAPLVRIVHLMQPPGEAEGGHQSSAAYRKKANEFIHLLGHERYHQHIVVPAVRASLQSSEE